MATELKVDFTCIPPKEVNASDQLAFKRLVLDAGEVSRNTLPALYDNALVVCFARVDGEIAGVGAIKRPFPSHRDGVFTAAKAATPPAAFTLELGWFHVSPKFEGNRIGSRMVEQLMPWTAGAPVYATSKVNKPAMHAALTRRGGFKVEGSDYPSSLDNNVLVRLFVRP